MTAASVTLLVLKSPESFMPMKRRGFVKGLLVSPVVPLIAQQPPAQTQTPAAPNPQPPREVPRQFGQANKLATVQCDTTAEARQLFFKADQYAALEKLGDVLVPPLQGKPGATEAGAALFLDFLISESPHDRQQLYRRGLDGLNASSYKQFNKHFAELDATQADTILKPLLVVRPWPEEMPEDHMQHFIAQVHQDLHSATTNSREWATASKTTNAPVGRRGFNQAIGLYWSPIDPVVKG
jgi:hypothetical protein